MHNEKGAIPGTVDFICYVPAEGNPSITMGPVSTTVYRDLAASGEVLIITVSLANRTVTGLVLRARQPLTDADHVMIRQMIRANFGGIAAAG